MNDRPPALPQDLTQKFVLAAHGDLGAVRQMLKETPSLVNAVWDWGGGDFETALGAAAHTGSREIALLLIEHGARVDLFAAAMLGQIGVVHAILEANPAARLSKGAHGIPLMAHARIGGLHAQTVVAYLEMLDALEKE